jgi:hypothetical protein
LARNFFGAIYRNWAQFTSVTYRASLCAKPLAAAALAQGGSISLHFSAFFFPVLPLPSANFQ